ncbi:hypothetical protein D1872_130710 [compost metagenome]
MIDEKLDFALAGLLGWVNWWDGERLTWVDGATKEFRRKVTDWQPSNDPAASLEVQAKALEIDTDTYIRHLGALICDRAADHYNIYSIAKLLNASPRQRAEAAYMTLSSRG